MAYTKKTVAKTTDENFVNTVDKANTTETENNDSIVAKKEEKRTFNKEDLIPCKSITNGPLYVTGDKTSQLYRWANYGDVEEVEYQDLVYMIRSKKASVFKPRFIVQDKNIVDQYPELKGLYNALYSTKDLKDILGLPVYQMKKAIEDLPEGAHDAIRGIAASMITSGSLDSVKKIKELDEIFNTNLLLTLVQK